MPLGLGSWNVPLGVQIVSILTHKETALCFNANNIVPITFTIKIRTDNFKTILFQVSGVNQDRNCLALALVAETLFGGWVQPTFHQ